MIYDSSPVQKFAHLHFSAAEGQREAEVLVAHDQLFDRLREGGTSIASDGIPDRIIRLEDRLGAAVASIR
jgi:hypothetical protein